MAQTLTTPAQTLPEQFRRVTMIGVPFDLGASRRGARLDRMRCARRGSHHSLERSATPFRISATSRSTRLKAKTPVVQVTLKNVREVRDANREIANAVEAAMREGAYPVVLGGDHSMAIGTLAGIARVNGPQGVIWVDAHGDLNTTASSPTGNIHGMSMAVAFGQVSDLFPAPEFPTPAADMRHSVFLGIRELDPQEKRTLLEHEILCFTMSDIDQLGEVIELAFQRAGQGPRSVHVSFDIDCLDPTLAPGTGTPVRGGLTYREAHLFMEQLWRSGLAHSLELSEVNPLLDEHNMTAKLANELICSALGKSIL